jgi:hypothetical protein
VTNREAVWLQGKAGDARMCLSAEKTPMSQKIDREAVPKSIRLLAGSLLYFGMTILFGHLSGVRRFGDTSMTEAFVA